jgi:hypothetical protein
MRQNTQDGTYITIRILKLTEEHIHNNIKFIKIKINYDNKSKSFLKEEELKYSWTNLINPYFINAGM